LDVEIDGDYETQEGNVFFDGEGIFLIFLKLL